MMFPRQMLESDQDVLVEKVSSKGIYQWDVNGYV